MERELRRHLRRAPAPQGFADRVMGVVDRRARGRRLRRRMLIAAGMVCLAIPAPILVRQSRERVREADAQRQFALAMRVTAKALFQARQEIVRDIAKSSEAER
jgi:hypothetical protein